MTEHLSDHDRTVGEQLAVLTATVKLLTDSVNRLSDALPRDYVTNGVWLQRNHLVDNRLNTMGREIGQLRTELATNDVEHKAEIKAVREEANSRRAPWWSTWSLVVAGVAVAWSILGPTITGP